MDALGFEQRESGRVWRGGVEERAIAQEFDGKGDGHWLRYPFLHEGDTLEKRRAVRAWLFAHGYKVAEVSMDFEDYLWNEPYARCMAKHD